MGGDVGDVVVGGIDVVMVMGMVVVEVVWCWHHVVMSYHITYDS